MLGHLGHILVGLADNVMVGRLGAAPLAAVSLGNSFVFVAFALGIGFSLAITPLIAEADGEKNILRGKLYFHNGLILCLILGIVMFVLLIFSAPLLSYMDQPPEVVRLAVPYLYIVAFSMIPLMIFQGYKQFTDGLSRTKHGMNATLVSNVVNVALNFVLIYGFWIFPRMEVNGAALGTLFSRFAMMFFMIYIVHSKLEFKPYLDNLKKIKLVKPAMRRLIDLGFPSAMQMLFEVGIFTAAIWLAGTIGTIDQAANQIALNLASMTFMIAVGLGVTATIRVGNQKGLKDYHNLRRISFSIFLQIFIIEFIFAILFFLLKNILPMAYIENKEVIETAASLLLIAGLFQLSDGMQVVVLGALRGMQDVKIPTYITFVAYWVIGLPVSYLLGKKMGFGSQGIWIGLLVGLTASAVFLFLRFNYLSKKLIHQNS
ncbi:MAG: MATE family efflux transporter [Lutimonas sp.]